MLGEVLRKNVIDYKVRFGCIGDRFGNVSRYSSRGWIFYFWV